MKRIKLDGWSGTVMVALLCTLLLAGAAWVLSVMTSRIDLETRLREQQQVAHGVSGWMEEVQARVVGQTTWDDAVQHLGISFDRKWAQTNIGQYLHDIAGLERAYVVDGQGRPVYGMVNGTDVRPESYDTVATQAAALVNIVRAAEARRLGFKAVAPFRSMLSKPIQASSISRIGDEPCIVTATLVQPDFGTVTLQGSAPVVVTVEALDKDFVTRFGDRFLLQNLSISQPDRRPAEGEADFALIASNGQRVATLLWQQQAPGSRLMQQAMPTIIGDLAMFMIATILLYIRSRRATHALLASESRSKFLAFHDHLTGLPNRAMLHDRLCAAFNALQRGGPPVGIFLIDLDRFKAVNDLYGHASGDALIVEIGSRILGLVRTNDTVTRLGGDEFAILSTGVTPRGMAKLADRIIEELSKPVDLPMGRVFVGASIGIALVDEALSDDSEALRRADLAMYRAKELGRGRYCFFDPEMDLMLKTRQAIEFDLRDALANDSLEMHYQPQVDNKGQIFGVEALIRWNHPERGQISPSYFIPIAEEGGLIEAVGSFTMRRAFTDSLRWPDLKVSVNVSALQLRSAGFTAVVDKLFKETGANPHRVEFEITEGILLSDDLELHRTLRRLRDMGLTIALDDFGTGYSSLSYLRKYPVDKLKIDKSFINNIGNDSEAEAVVGAIIKLAQALNLDVIAEGVETEAQRSGLQRVGCREIQGYLYSKPIAADQVANFVSASKRTAA